MKHQQSPLIQSSTPRSTAYAKGKYGRLFPWLPPLGPDDDTMRLKMKDLADIMYGSKGGVNSRKPAGYTYLGQFLAHDLTFDTTSIKEQQVDPEQINNFRTPSLDLDSIYGAGPASNPHLYTTNDAGDLTRFLLYEVEVPAKDGYGPPMFYDLPRLKTGTAVIADPRNDENLFVSQLHVAFLMLHNYFEDSLPSSVKGDARFLEAQKLLRWHYQYVILHDYLNKVLDPEIVEKSMVRDNHGHPNLQYFDWRNEPFIPLEFSGAVFRFGHSQVREKYKMHQQTRMLLFNKRPGEQPETYVDWKEFLGLPPVNPLATVDQKLVEPLFKIPAPAGMPEINLAYRNLIRGLQLQLPSGQAIGRAMGLGDKILDREKFKQASVGPKNDPSKIKFPEYDDIEKNPAITEFLDNTPLWYYILLEAQILGKQHLGPVGSQIVAEVIIGLIQGDKTSFLNHDPNWKPEKVQNNPNEPFTMQDLLEMADIYEGALVKNL